MHSRTRQVVQQTIDTGVFEPSHSTADTPNTSRIGRENQQKYNDDAQVRLFVGVCVGENFTRISLAERLQLRVVRDCSRQVPFFLGSVQSHIIPRNRGPRG